jgi:two-component system sensor histidine kinase/response regulator
MRNLRFSTQLIIGFSVILFFSIISSILSLVQIQSVRSQADLAYMHPYTVSNSVRDVNSNINAIHRSMKDIVLAENPDELNKYISLVNYYDSLVLIEIDRVKENFLGEKSIVVKLTNEYLDWQRIRTEPIELVKNGNISEAIKITKGKGAAQVALLLERTKMISDFAENKANELHQKTLKTENQSIQILFISIAALLILSITIAYIIVRNVSQPISLFIAEINRVVKKEGSIDGKHSQRNEKELFSDTALELKTAYRKLESFNSELEQQIGIRTKELLKAKEKAEESETKYRKLFEVLPVGATISDAAGNILDSNQMSESLLGLSEEEQSKRKIDGQEWGIINKDNSTMDSDEYASTIALKENRLVKDIEMGIVKGTDEVTWISVNATPINLEGYGVVIAYNDITERKRAVQELKESEAKLRELNATKDKLFSIISHDLKSPLNSVLGFSDLLIKNIETYDIERSKYFATLINTSAKNNLGLIDNLLTWARTQTEQIEFIPKNLELHPIVEEIFLRLNSTAWLKNINLISTLSDDIVAYADHNMLHTILRNLVSNAIKFTDSDGKVDISAVSKQDHIEISVNDNGVGINEENQKRLFGAVANFTLLGTANESSSGLGLMLCKEFVEKHQGKIWVKSELGKGSKFVFTLPVSNK